MELLIVAALMFGLFIVVIKWIANIARNKVNTALKAERIRTALLRIEPDQRLAAIDEQLYGADIRLANSILKSIN